MLAVASAVLGIADVAGCINCGDWACLDGMGCPYKCVCIENDVGGWCR